MPSVSADAAYSQDVIETWKSKFEKQDVIS
jgi:hypothetical protein